MSVRELTFKVYTIEDHPNKEAVLQTMREWHDMYVCGDENTRALLAFCDHFHLTDTDWSVSTWSYSYAKAKVHYELEDMRGVRLWKYLQNSGLLKYRENGELRDLLAGDCPFTGYCADEWLLDALRDFMEKPDMSMTFQALMDKCMSDWVSTYVEDWQDAYTDEALESQAAVMGYEFYENGGLAP